MDHAERETLHRQVIEMYRRDMAGSPPHDEDHEHDRRLAEAAEFIRLFWIADDDLPERQTRAVIAVEWLGEVGNLAVARVLEGLRRRGPRGRAEAAREAIRRIRERSWEDRPAAPLFPSPPPLRARSAPDEATRHAEQRELLAWGVEETPNQLHGVAARLGEIGDCRAVPFLHNLAAKAAPDVKAVAEAALLRVKERALNADWLAPGGPASRPAPEPARSLAPEPARPAEVDRSEEARAIEQDELIRRCEAGYPGDLSEAALRLGEIGDQRAARVLHRLAQSEVPGTREAAREALERLRERLGVAERPPPVVRRVVPAPPAVPPPPPQAEAPGVAEAADLVPPPATDDEWLRPGFEGLTPEERALLPQ